jgi:hypothetical protein
VEEGSGVENPANSSRNTKSNGRPLGSMPAFKIGNGFAKPVPGSSLSQNTDVGANVIILLCSLDGGYSGSLEELRSRVSLQKRQNPKEALLSRSQSRR